MGPLKSNDGITIDSDANTAELLNNFFAEVFTTENENDISQNDVNIEPSVRLSSINVTEDMVFKYIKGLKTNKAAGPDGIFPKVLYELAEEVVRPLTLLFRTSLSEGQVPMKWKMANITPLFKKGDKLKVSNYRPVSLTSVPGKILEMIIRDKIVEHLEKNNLINNTQHGFRKGRSCVTNLLEYLNILTKYIDEGIPVDVIYLDLRKAFDTVPHRRLLFKLKDHGIEGDVFKWIENWLGNRQQRVVLRGQTSSWKSVTSSVIQGSVLGPICFTIYMNDLEEGLGSFVSKFADDTKVLHPIRNINDKQALQNDINKLLCWNEKWQMSFNAEKCTVLHFGYNNPKYEYFMNEKVIMSKEEEKDLGVYISTSLKPHRQCAEAVKKANRTVGMIKRNFRYFDKNIIIQLYKSLVRPHLDYCVQVWRPYHQMDVALLEGVQRRVTKLIPNLRGLSYHQRLKNVNLMTFEQRCIRHDLLTVYKMFQGNLKLEVDKYFDIVSEPITRGHTKKIRPKSVRLDVRKFSFFHRVCGTWNQLPNDVVSAPTLLSFKKRLDASGILWATPPIL